MHFIEELLSFMEVEGVAAVIGMEDHISGHGYIDPVCNCPKQNKLIVRICCYRATSIPAAAPIKPNTTPTVPISLLPTPALELPELVLPNPPLPFCPFPVDNAPGSTVALPVPTTVVENVVIAVGGGVESVNAPGVRNTNAIDGA